MYKFEMENSINDKNQSFTNLLDLFIDLYKNLQDVLLISLNDTYLSENLLMLSNNPLISDTIEYLKHVNFNLDEINKIASSDYTTFKNNLFVKYSSVLNELLQSELISHYNIKEKYIPGESKSKTLNMKKQKRSDKKSYEVEILSSYMNSITSRENLNVLVEMGCGKSYLNDEILKSEKMIYFGIDKKEEFVTKCIMSHQNSYILNYNVTINNFINLYDSEISPILQKEHLTENKALIFGLHSCGNLTSDTLKVFLRYDFFSHIVIVGCCLNLLKEYVTQEACQTEQYKNYIKSIGYDNKGNFLEQTLIYDYDFDQIGYPLSKHIVNSHSELFLSRTVRNSSMQNFPKNEEKIINSGVNIFYKKIFYRTILQAYFEKYIPELKLFYGFGKIDLNLGDSFSDYSTKVLNMVTSKQMNTHWEVVKGYIDNNNHQTNSNELYEDMKQSENILWALYTVRLKFSRIVEYIIALDRVVFLKESGINNMDLVKIFDENMSVRNLLIYASK